MGGRICILRVADSVGCTVLVTVQALKAGLIILVMHV